MRTLRLHREHGAKLPLLRVTDDGSCVQGGCMDSRFDAFEPGATFDDGSCPPVLPGCMQYYRALATVEHEPSSCLYQGPGRGLGLG